MKMEELLMMLNYKKLDRVSLKRELHATRTSVAPNDYLKRALAEDLVLISLK